MNYRLYRKLQQRIDKISYGFPKSWLGMDLLFLSQVFEPDDARAFLLMADGPQTAKDFADANGISEEEARATFDRMVMRGQIFRRHRVDAQGQPYDEYEQHPFAMGFLEWQIKNPKSSWLYSLSLYIISADWGKRMSQTMPFYRTIPMHKEFVEGSVVTPYDDIEEVLNRHHRFAVANCLCRTLDKVKPNNPCSHPLETCIETDDYATFYIETGMGREITRDEALAILRDGEKDGRVINVTNSKDGENICSCCECGCGMLYMKVHYPGPSKDFWGNYYSVIDDEKCITCGACVKKCPFHVLSIEPGEAHGRRGTVRVNTPDCLGCGLCVSACKRDALHLHKKSPDKYYICPDTYEDAVGEWTRITKR